MSEEPKVHAIRGDVVVSEGKQMFLDAVATAYDKLANGRDGPFTPVALVFCFVELHGRCNPSYLTTSEVDDRNLLYISRAVSGINSEYPVWDRSA